MPLVTTREFVETGAEIGLIFVLFVLGLEHSSRDLLATARSAATPGAVDLLLNAAPGVIAGLVLGWGWLAAAFLGGSRTSRPPAWPRSSSNMRGRTLGERAGSS